MGLYCHIDLSNLQEESETLLTDLAAEIEDEFESAFDVSGEDQEDEEEEISYDSITINPSSLDTSQAANAFREAFMASIDNLCPVRTGYLKSTCHCDINDDAIDCYADAEYAQYVEYGTYKMMAQPYFEPSIQAGIEAAKEVQRTENNRIAENFVENAAAEVEDGMNSIDGGGLLLFIIMMILMLLLMLIIELFKTIIMDTLNETTDACYDDIDIEVI